MSKKLNRDDVEPPKPSSAELSAQRWHDRDRNSGAAGRDHADCWCSCVVCKAVNPWYQRAWAAKFADICTRVGALEQVPLRRNLGRRVAVQRTGEHVSEVEG